MSRLHRPCLDCGATVRGKSRCIDCQRRVDNIKSSRRPDLHNDAKERERRRRAVADHRAIVGDWCPGWAGRPAHQSADLTADHVREVRLGGQHGGRLVVRCRSCNAAKANAAIAAAAKMLSPQDGQATTPRPSKFPTLSAAPVPNGTPDVEDGPVMA
jgi:5-methylcytosine-specific restriction protein A